MRFKCINCKESFTIERPNLVDFNYCPRCGRTMWATLYCDEKGYLNHQHPIPDKENTIVDLGGVKAVYPKGDLKPIELGDKEKD